MLNESVGDKVIDRTTDKTMSERVVGKEQSTKPQGGAVALFHQELAD
jgi:hypothetical protein